MADHETQCELYDVPDPFSAEAYEACDRIQAMDRYASTDYVKELASLRKGSSWEERLHCDHSHAEDVRTWALERDLPLLEMLARSAAKRIAALESFALSVEAQARMDERDEPRSLGQRLMRDEFDVQELVNCVNESRDSHFVEVLGDSLYTFISDVLRIAQAQFDGNVGRALASKFTFDHGVQWHHRLGVDIRLTYSEPTCHPAEYRGYFIECLLPSDESFEDYSGRRLAYAEKRRDRAIAIARVFAEAEFARNGVAFQSPEDALSFAVDAIHSTFGELEEIARPRNAPATRDRGGFDQMPIQAAK